MAGKCSHSKPKHVAVRSDNESHRFSISRNVKASLILGVIGFLLYTDVANALKEVDRTFNDIEEVHDQNQGQHLSEGAAYNREEDLMEGEVEDILESSCQRESDLEQEKCSGSDKYKDKRGEEKVRLKPEKHKTGERTQNSKQKTKDVPPQSGRKNKEGKQHASKEYAIPPRPGRNKNGPPPIILTADKGEYVLDASHFKTVDSPPKERNTPPSKKSNTKTKTNPTKANAGEKKKNKEQNTSSLNTQEHKGTGQRKESSKDQVSSTKSKVNAKKNDAKVKAADNGIPPRPGRNKNGPPPIVLTADNNQVVLDSSHFKIVDSPEEESNTPPRVQKSNTKDKQKKSIGGGTRENQFQNTPSSNTKSKAKSTKGASSDEDRVKNKQESTTTAKVQGKNSNQPKKKVVNGKDTIVDAKQKGKGTPIVLNAENNQVVLDSSTIQHEERPSQTKSPKQERMKATKSDNNKGKKNKGKDNSKAGEKDDFKARYQKTFTPKKIFADGRRIPPIELLHQKKSNSSVRVYLFDDFLSTQECDGLIKAHKSHIKELNKQPIMCFDSISILRRHIKEAKLKVKVDPNDFTSGTRCLNSSFSSQLQDAMKSNWSYSTSFYPAESPFSKISARRIEEAMGLHPDNGGKFQITSYPVGKVYKAHTDCILGGKDKRDRVVSVIMYLSTVKDGGETTFPELGIWVKPKKGRAIVWNNMSPKGVCEPHSQHEASIVKSGSKYILIRWYYYKSFFTLGKRQPPPNLPPRDAEQAMVTCDASQSCRWYDEWTYNHLLDYDGNKLS